MAPAFSKFAISVSFGVAGDSCSGLSLKMLHLAKAAVGSTFGKDGLMLNPNQKQGFDAVQEDIFEKNNAVFNKSHVELPPGQSVSRATPEKTLQLAVESLSKSKDFQDLRTNLSKLTTDQRGVLKDRLLRQLKDENLEPIESWDDKFSKEVLPAAEEFRDGLGRQLESCASGLTDPIATVESYVCEWTKNTKRTLIVHGVFVVIVVALVTWGVVWCCYRDAITACCNNMQAAVGRAGHGIRQCCERGDNARQQCTRAVGAARVAITEACGAARVAITGACKSCCKDKSKCCWTAKAIAAEGPTPAAEQGAKAESGDEDRDNRV